MSEKSHKHRHKSKKFMSSVLYYILIVALAVGIVLVIGENRQRREERTEYKQTLIDEETGTDIDGLDDMMVRPTAKPTETQKGNDAAGK